MSGAREILSWIRQMCAKTGHGYEPGWYMEARHCIDAELAKAEGPCADWVWVYEDQLPEDIDGRVYDFLWPSSRVIEGARMFPWPRELSYYLKPADDGAGKGAG